MTLFLRRVSTGKVEEWDGTYVTSQGSSPRIPRPVVVVTNALFLTHWPLGDTAVFSSVHHFQTRCSWWYRKQFMKKSLQLNTNWPNRGQHWFRLVAWCRLAKVIAWANVDAALCRHMVSLGYSELISLLCIYWILRPCLWDHWSESH